MVKLGVINSHLRFSSLLFDEIVLNLINDPRVIPTQPRQWRRVNDVFRCLRCFNVDLCALYIVSEIYYALQYRSSRLEEKLNKGCQLFAVEYKSLLTHKFALKSQSQFLVNDYSATYNQPHAADIQIVTLRMKIAELLKKLADLKANICMLSGASASTNAIFERL